jgi:hypothetical protein
MSDLVAAAFLPNASGQKLLLDDLFGLDALSSPSSLQIDRQTDRHTTLLLPLRAPLYSSRALFSLFRLFRSSGMEVSKKAFCILVELYPVTARPDII